MPQARRCRTTTATARVRAMAPRRPNRTRRRVDAPPFPAGVGGAGAAEPFPDGAGTSVSGRWRTCTASRRTPATMQAIETPVRTAPTELILSLSQGRKSPTGPPSGHVGNPPDVSSAGDGSENEDMTMADGGVIGVGPGGGQDPPFSTGAAGRVRRTPGVLSTRQRRDALRLVVTTAQ